MPARVVPVTAVLVAHDGSPWLPEVLSALADSTVRPAHVVAVDTGSTDTSVELLRRAVGRVVELPRRTSYAAAVAAGLRDAPESSFVWLLHDDSAPDPDALERLLGAAADSPTAGVLGPRAVDWTDPRLLVEVGLSVDVGGRAAHGVERGELDQGQYGGVRDVLAVGTAGALVRRGIFRAIGGLDPELVLREDLDLGWRVRAAGGRVVVVPQSRVRHARALTTGARPVDSAPGSTARTDRAAALHVLLTNTAGWRAALLLPRLLLGSLLTSLVLLLGRRPGEARDELLALLSVLGRPGRLLVARRARAGSRTARPGDLSPFFVPRGARLRAAATALLDRSSGTAAVPTVEDAPGEPPLSPLRRLARRPGARLTAGLLLVALLAARDLLGGGVLSGGRLLPAPPGAGDLWAAWAAAQDEPHLAVLAALATALLGSAGGAVDLVLLGCVPLAGAVAWAVLGRVVRHRLLRAWAAAAWALLPVATGAVAAGRLGAAVVHVVLPALLLAGWDLLSGDPRTRGWHRAWALGLALTLVAALQPVAWLLLAVLLLGASAARGWAAPPAGRRLLACAVAALLPALLLLPWAPDLLLDLQGPGRTTAGLADAALPAWHLLLLQPGGPGAPGLLVVAPLVLAALAGLLPDSRPRLAAAGWGLALVGLTAAVLLSRSTSRGEAGWPGVPLDLAAAGLLLAVVAGADGLQERLARTSFGWRQLTAVLVVVAAAAVPVVSAVDWVRRGADGPVQRVDRALLPAYLRAELAADPGARALVLAPRPDGSVGYAITGSDGPRLDDADPAPDLAGAVAALLTPTPSTAADALADNGIRVVALTSGSSAALDVQPGLAREPGERPALWRVLPEGRPAPPLPSADRVGVALQALLLLAAAVLSGPGLRPRRGLLREPRP